MTKKQLNINGKSLSIFLLFTLIGTIVIAYLKYQELESKTSFLESDNFDLTEKVEDLENERNDLQSLNNELESKLNNAESNTQYYQQKIAQNEISIESDIEYGLLKKYGLTNFIVPEEDYKTYKLGQLRVKYRVNGYKEYSELLKAKEKDYFMKYTMLLSAVYDGSGLDHFYEYYPY